MPPDVDKAKLAGLEMIPSRLAAAAGEGMLGVPASMAMACRSLIPHHTLVLLAHTPDVIFEFAVPLREFGSHNVPRDA